MPTPFSRTTRSLTQDSSKYAVIAWLLGGIILAAWLLWFCFASITVYEVSSKARLEVNRNAHPIAAQIAGKIIATPISLGQEVKANEVLIELDASSDTLRLQEAQSRLQALPPQIAALSKQIADLEQAKTKDHQAALAAIDSAKSQQQGASTALAFAKDNERRLTEVSGSVAQIEASRAHAEAQKLGSAKDALSADITRITLDAETHSHQKQAEIEDHKREAAKLKGEMDTAQTTIARLKQDIEQHLIRAPATGQIGDLSPLQVGTYVAVGEKLGTVVPHSELRIVADFPPASVLGRIHPGQTSQMRLDGFPWAQFGTIKATVSRVGSEIRDNQVRVEFIPELTEKSRIVLQHGLPGAIEVSIEQISPAVMVLRASGQLLPDSRPAQSANEIKP